MDGWGACSSAGYWCVAVLLGIAWRWFDWYYCRYKEVNLNSEGHSTSQCESERTRGSVVQRLVAGKCGLLGRRVALETIGISYSPPHSTAQI